MKIAVIICELVFDSQKAFMKGIERKVRDLKDICSVFCVHGNVRGNAEHSGGEYMIFRLPDISEFDGVVFVKNTFADSLLEKELVDSILEKNIPCVCIDCFDKNFVNITSDEEGSVYALTEHMIKEHGCKDFYFIKGNENGNDATLRMAGFLRALSDNGISFSKERAFQGTYEYRSGVEAARYFMNLNEKMADCIVCSNDQMAVGVYMELKKNGYKIPRDVKITGIDYDFVSRVISTRLTTIKRQQYQKGIKAVEILHNYNEYRAGDNFVLPISISYGESCGCRNREENHNDVDDALAVDRYEQSELTKLVKSMTVSLMSKTKYVPLVEEMRRYAYGMNPKELYLCLNVRPEVKIDYSDFSARLLNGSTDKDYSDTMINLISCKNGQPAHTGDRFFRKDLFPPVAEGGREGVTYYFLPIHYLNENFGYAILGESGELIRNDFFPNWTTIVSNAFENNRKLDLMEQMISLLDRMWIYDTLTGIYNRAGFYKLSEPIISEAILKNKPICVIFLDVDGLKVVNDNYGHDAGDDLIKSVANVLKETKKHGEILMRYGGDEFVLLAADYDAAKAEHVISEIEATMEKLNESSPRPYRIEASAGYTITTLTDPEQLAGIIEEADKEMYKKKYVKKALKFNK